MVSVPLIVLSLVRAVVFVACAKASDSSTSLKQAARVIFPINFPRSSKVIIDAIVGPYENFEYSGSGKNNWHYVSISKIDSTTMTWTNRAGVKWTLTLQKKGDGYDPVKLTVGTDSPYYKSGHTVATVVWNNDYNAVKKILGPWNEAYTRLYTASDVAESVVGTYENLQYSGQNKK